VGQVKIGGTFSETTIVDYRLSFATKENKRPFPVSVSREQMEVTVFH
jgi:hypothetical protein